MYFKHCKRRLPYSYILVWLTLALNTTVVTGLHMARVRESILENAHLEDVDGDRRLRRTEMGQDNVKQQPLDAAALKLRISMSLFMPSPPIIQFS
jgi:hypothetical protein